MVQLKSALNGSELTLEGVTQILAKLNEVRELMPFAVGLSSRDRLTYPALGSKGTQFVQRSLESMRQNPSLVPAFVDVKSIESSYTMYNNLLGIVESVQQLERLVSDTMHVAGSSSRSQAFEFYNSVQRGAKANVPGAQIVFENLKTRFTKSARAKVPVTETDGSGEAPV
jgi:hypothetical protein